VTPPLPRPSCDASAREFRFIQPLFAFYTMVHELHWHLYGLMRTFAGETPMLLIVIGGGLWRFGARLVERLNNRIFASSSKSCPLIQLCTLTRFKLVIIVTQSPATPTREKLLEPMIALAHCGRQQRILIAGEKSIELMFELEHQGYTHVASVANCGRAAKRYDVALVDWRRRTFRSLEATLTGLSHAEGVLVVATDPQKAHAREALSAALEKRGFVIEDTIVHAGGYAVSARRRALRPVLKAA